MTEAAADHVWERLYRERPHAFRHYPNEELVRFLGRRYFHALPRERRREVRILEVGCGNAANLWAIAREGFDAYGMDIAPSALDLARATLARWGVEADLRTGDAQSLPYDTASFDAVVDVGTLTCLTFTDLRTAYREVHRVLRAGGRFFSYHLGRETWDYDHGGGTLIDRHTFDNIPSPDAVFPNLGTISMLEPQDAEGLLREAGFREIAIETVTKTYADRTKQVQYLVIECLK